jgi:hypothetical protein
VLVHYLKVNGAKGAATAGINGGAVHLSISTSTPAVTAVVCPWIYSTYRVLNLNFSKMLAVELKREAL